MQKSYPKSKNQSQNLCRLLLFPTLILSLIYILLPCDLYCQRPASKSNIPQTPSNYSYNPTNISHLVFGIVASTKTWASKRRYVEAWWRPNSTRGYIFLDKSPIQYLPWAQTSPPLRISEDNSKYASYHKHAMRFAIRMIRVIEETFKEESKNSEARWFVMADDDTVLLVDNLVEVLSRYDHQKYFYIGMSSECVASNKDNSFEMAFGGAGYALSYPLAKALALNMDTCIKRYPTLYGNDHMLQSCVADLGVSLTQEKGFHQIDLHGDISGFLSSHPHSPLISLHHLDAVEPIFPSMDRFQAVTHLMESATLDSSRLLQQSVCYLNQKNWTFSVSWGYSVHVYESIIPPSILRRPLETFRPWKKGASPPYMFNARRFSDESCEIPHVFFFDSIGERRMNQTVTSYARKSPRGLDPCFTSGNHSADSISQLHVFSPLDKLQSTAGNKRECCDVVQVIGMDSLGIKLRTCMTTELV